MSGGGLEGIDKCLRGMPGLVDWLVTGLDEVTFGGRGVVVVLLVAREGLVGEVGEVPLLLVCLGGWTGWSEG